MIPTFSWEGATDDPGGVATYSCGREKITVPLQTFKQALDVSNILQKAYAMGGSDARNRLRSSVERAFADDLSNNLSVGKPIDY